MQADDPEDELVDQVVDRVMRGEKVDVDALLADRPGTSATTRAKLAKIAGAFRRGDTIPGTKPDAPSLPFERLGHYRLVRRLGEGGMGTVYLAEHEFLARRVALKLVRPELALSPVVRQRFLREARSIARLRHPGIVAVHDAGEEQGITYIAMELVEGHGLDELVAQAAARGEHVPLEDCVRWARDIARALQCAHDAGIVHRDVKPSNVRVTPDGRALLLDFGLASVSELAALSQSGFFHGTPHYASPEQVAAERAEIDARSDVYSLGVTLYECLAGSLPFQAETPQQLFHQILVKEPPPPRRTNAQVDARLEGIVLRCMAKRREDRYASASALADALAEWIVIPRRAPAPAAMRRTPRRATWLIGLVAIAGGAWFALHGGGAADGAPASPPAAAGTESGPSRPLTGTERPLFGAADLPFDQRFTGWGAVAGEGTFGADHDSSGVTGTCDRAMSGKPRELGADVVSVSGHVEPLLVMRETMAEEVPTERAGVALELAGAGTYGVLLERTASGYRARAHELEHDGRGAWTTVNAAGEPLEGEFGDGHALAVELSWDDRAVQLVFGAAGAAEPRRVILPLARRAEAPPRLWLLVDRGHARYTRFVAVSR